MDKLVIKYRPSEDGRQIRWTVQERDGYGIVDGFARNLKVAKRRAERALRKMESVQQRRDRLWAEIEEAGRG